MIRVGDLERSIAFYLEVLGMRLLRKKDYPDGKFTLAFVGYGPESDGAVIELTHNWESDKYDLGNGFGHIALEVDDAHAACGEIKKRGGNVVREAVSHHPVLRLTEGALLPRRRHSKNNQHPSTGSARNMR